MRTVEQVLAQLAEDARANGRMTFVSWRLRLDCEFVRDLGLIAWRINGKQSSEAQAVAALERARAGRPVEA
jgi:hypothetical protein